MLPWRAEGALADLSESLPAALGRPHGLLRLLQLHLLADLSAVLLLSALGLSFRYQTLGMADKDRAAQVIATVLPAGLALARLPLLLCMERSCRQTVRLFEERSQPAARVLRRLLRALQHRKLQWSSAAFAAVCSLAVTWSLTMPPCDARGRATGWRFVSGFAAVPCDTWCSVVLALAVVYAALGLAVAAAAKVARRSRQSAEPRGGLPLELLACLPTHVAGGAHAPARGADLCCAICLETVQDGETLRRLPCGHEFHAACADGWLFISAACPMRCEVDWASAAASGEGPALGGARGDPASLRVLEEPQAALGRGWAPGGAAGVEEGEPRLAPQRASGEPLLPPPVLEVA